MNRPHTNTFITNIHTPNLSSNSRLNRRTYRGNNFLPNISNYYKQSANNSKKIQSLGKTFEKIAANTEKKFRNIQKNSENHPNYYKQSANNSKKIQGLGKVFKDLAANTEENFRIANMKQKIENEINQRKIDENTRKVEEIIRNAQMRQKLHNELKQIKNDETKRKSRRTQKQINNETRQEKEERNQLEREIEENQENLYANYPSMRYLTKEGSEQTTPENIIKYMSINPNKVTKFLKQKYKNSQGLLANQRSIGRYNQLTTNSTRPIKQKISL